MVCTIPHLDTSSSDIHPRNDLGKEYDDIRGKIFFDPDFIKNIAEMRQTAGIRPINWMPVFITHKWKAKVTFRLTNYVRAGYNATNTGLYPEWPETETQPRRSAL